MRSSYFQMLLLLFAACVAWLRGEVFPEMKWHFSSFVPGDSCVFLWIQAFFFPFEALAKPQIFHVWNSSVSPVCTRGCLLLGSCSSPRDVSQNLFTVIRIFPAAFYFSSSHSGACKSLCLFQSCRTFSKPWGTWWSTGRRFSLPTGCPRWWMQMRSSCWIRWGLTWCCVTFTSRQGLV